MQSKQIRSSFLDFFKHHGHQIVRSATIFPPDDPSLLFTNAGMNQFKEIFLGHNPKNLKRVTNLQKCMRVSGKHNDLESVGKDGQHHTLFEMMGNWSFGDYYKKEAVSWAWELLTKIWAIDKSRLYATVYKDDNEAYNIWTNETDLDKSHIFKFGEQDNFWEMAETGPCGPCSEIHYDLLPDDHSRKAIPNTGDGRIVEIWNLVFIQYNRKTDGSLENLSQKFVDTGAGFERIVSVIQNKKSNYSTDLFEPIIACIEKICGRNFSDDLSSMPFRVIADHSRALAFCLSDDVFPSNEGRGYVVRRILRRAFRYGRNLGINEPFLFRVVESVIQNFGEFYPEMVIRKNFILNMVKAEEEQFEKTLDAGMERLSRIIKPIVNKFDTMPAAGVISGEDAFMLYDTYGFPLDLTQLIAEENNIKVDIKQFYKAMEEQKKKSQEGAKFKNKEVIDFSQWKVINKGEESVFIGYDLLKAPVKIVKYFLENDKILFTLDKTPFFAEGGGQISDRGYLEGENCRINIDAIFKEGDTIVHKGNISGILSENGKLMACVDEESRTSICKNHTTTHLLQASLRKVLGTHVKQAGSMVRPDGFRFDFNHFKALSAKEISAVEYQVNCWIHQNIHVLKITMNYEESQLAGALAFFGEKYGERVRVIKIGDISLELCGGTHVGFTGEIGCVVILSESSVASGIRRIEAITGPLAWKHIADERMTLYEVRNLIEANNKPVTVRLMEILDQKKEAELQLRNFKNISMENSVRKILSSTEEIEGIKLCLAEAADMNKRDFLLLAEKLQDKCNGVAVLFGNVEKKGVIMVCVGQEGLAKSIDAGIIARDLASLINGKGGGSADRGQAGGASINDISKLKIEVHRKLTDVFLQKSVAVNER